jgi:hypothetical protein
MCLRGLKSNVAHEPLRTGLREAIVQPAKEAYRFLTQRSILLLNLTPISNSITTIHTFGTILRALEAAPDPRLLHGLDQTEANALAALPSPNFAEHGTAD